MTTTKALTGFQVKDADKGLVTAVFSQFNVIDLDGDVTMPDAFTEGAKVKISAYNHASWGGALPVGKGTIRTDDQYAYLDGEFFMDTPQGKATFDTVKALDELGEWSYSLHNVVSERGEWEGRPANVLKKITVEEVSPVIKGAGINTHTVAMKGDGLKFAEHAEQVLATLDAFVTRHTEVMALRAEKGKTIAAEPAEVCARIAKTAQRLVDGEPNPPEDDEAALDALVAAELALVASNLPQELLP